MDEAKVPNVISALSEVMKGLPGIPKGSAAAPAQGGYAYRGIEAIASEAAPLLAKHGVVFVPKVESYETREIVVNQKPWTDTILHVTYTVYGPGGVSDCITVGPLIGIGRDNSDKGANKAMTQAFKYALIQTLCIADEKDDADSGSPEADAHPVPLPRSPQVVTWDSEAGAMDGEARGAAWVETYAARTSQLSEDGRAELKALKANAGIGWPPSLREANTLDEWVDMLLTSEGGVPPAEELTDIASQLADKARSIGARKSKDGA